MRLVTGAVLALLLVTSAALGAPPPCQGLNQLGCQPGVSTPPPFGHTTLIGPDGKIGGKWQEWVFDARVPAPALRVRFSLNVRQCIDGDHPGTPIPPACSWPDPFSVAVQPGFGARDSLYFELGHIFDWTYLTGWDRQYLADHWGDLGQPWDDSLQAILTGQEDGLEAIFALVYADCAWGRNDQGQWLYAIDNPPLHEATAHITIDTCAFIRQIALRGRLTA